MRDQVSLLMQTQGCALGPCDFRGIKASWKMCVQARWTRATETDRDTDTETHTHTRTRTDTRKHTGWHAGKDTRTHTHTQRHAHTHRYARRHPGIAGRDREHERVRERERERQNKVKLHELASNRSFYSTKLFVRYHQFMMGKPARYSQELRPSTSTCITTLNWTRDCLCDLFGRIFLMGLGVVSFCLAEFAFTVYKVPVHFNLIACFLTFQVR